MTQNEQVSFIDFFYYSPILNLILLYCCEELTIKCIIPLLIMKASPFQASNLPGLHLPCLGLLPDLVHVLPTVCPLASCSSSSSHVLCPAHFLCLFPLAQLKHTFWRKWSNAASNKPLPKSDILLVLHWIILHKLCLNWKAYPYTVVVSSLSCFPSSSGL